MGVENKLPRIRVNDRATIRLIGETSNLTGHVERIAGGIEDRERSAGSIRPFPGSGWRSVSRCVSCSIRCRTA